MLVKNPQDALRLPRGELDLVEIDENGPKIGQFSFSEEDVILMAEHYLGKSAREIDFHTQAELVAVSVNLFRFLGPDRLASAR